MGHAHKITGVIDKESVEALDPYTPENVFGEKKDPLATSKSSKPDAKETDNKAETPPGDGQVLPNGDYSLFWGTYKGYLICPENAIEAYGVLGTYDNPEVTITLDKDGFVTLNYTFESVYSFSMYGVKMNGTTTLPVNFRAGYLLRTMAGYMSDQEFFSTDFVGTTVTTYAGEAYQGGGGTASSPTNYQISFMISFELKRTDGKDKAYASGYVKQKLPGAAEPLFMSFDDIVRVD